MPMVQRKYNPDRISDFVEGPFPLRLVRFCLQEVWKLIENPTIFLTTVGSGGSGGGSSATLATRVVVQWKANGPYRVDTDVDGAWVVNTACEVRSVYLWRRQAGKSGSTVIDLNRNGVSMYTNQGNRPTVTYNDSDGTVLATLPNSIALVAGDIVTIDCDEKDSGLPLDFSVTLEAA